MQVATALITLKNTQLGKNEPIHHSIKKSVIHIIFTHRHPLYLNLGPRKMPLPPYSSYLFYEQNNDFNFNIESEEESNLVYLQIPITALHRLISTGIDEFNFAATNVLEKERYHHISDNSEDVNNCIADIISISNPLMLEAKKFELLSHFFSTPDVQSYKCPFLNQKENVTKVREAKDVLIEDLQKSPTIKELSKLVGLNEHNLKTGFKEIYGKPIHTFLKDHKMYTAKRLIDSKEYKINEIADKVGYSNVSHFIEAFKQKFGTTPKQYELEQQ